ncbi:MAG: PD-(D/E)XK nuclease family protein [Deltaproteobacteria bacterium]
MTHLILPLSSSLVSQVADMLLKDRPCTQDLSDAACVFPGKRPALYLRQELARRIGRAFLPPAIFDVDGFMSYLARMTERGRGLREADLVTRLHHVFSAAREAGKTRLSERFEDFLFWGMRLLEIFDEFGTELVDAADIEGAVVIALHEAGLSEEAQGIWQTLPDLFKAYKRRLLDEHIATRGENYRSAAEAIDRIDLPFDQCVIAGFTALTRAEEKVFASLARRGIARMVIQEDRQGGFHTRPDFAARLIGVIPGTWERMDGPVTSPPSPHIQIFRAPDLHAELDLARKVMQEIPLPDTSDMAICLPDPGALVPVLAWLVEETGAPFNVSMGYPLERTPAASLLMKALDAVESEEGGACHVPEYLAFLKHPIVMSLTPKDAPETGDLRPVVHAVSQACTERRLIYVDPAGLEDIMEYGGAIPPGLRALLSQVHKKGLFAPRAARTVREFADALSDLLCFATTNGPAAAHPFGREAIETIIRLLDEAAYSPLGPEPMTAQGFRRLLAHLFRSTPIPFQGSPLAGIQVLGFLETRSLRFRHVLLFDASEGILPGAQDPDPILPDGIRRALGLPARETAVGIVRHHFRALVAGAGTVHIFSTEKEDAEPSRFVQELIWEEEKKKGAINAVPITSLTESYRVPLPEHRPRPKTNEVLSLLGGFSYSPQALDTYLGCPFRFYARYVLGIEEPRPMVQAEIDPLITGEIVHETLEEFYRMFLGKPIEPCEAWEARLEAVCDQTLEKRFAEPASWSGPVRLLREILLYRLQNFVEDDLKTARGRRLLALEDRAQARLHLNDGSSVNLSGRLDRVELDPDGTLWVLDYKTGRADMPSSLPHGPVSGRHEIKKAFGSLQLPVYLILSQGRQDVRFKAMNAGIYAIGGTGGKDGRGKNGTLRPLIPEGTPWKEALEMIFIPAVQSVIGEILDPEVPFIEDPSDPGSCRNCPYSQGLCRAAG